MSKFSHECRLPVKDTTGLPRLAPNAPWFEVFCRNVRKLFILNPNHFKCKSLFRNNSAMLEERKRHTTSKHFFVIHPLSRFNAFLEVMFFFAWLYAIFCGPMTIWQPTLLFVQMNIVLPIRLILIALFFNVGYIDKKHKQIVIEPKKIICRYLRTYFFFDFFSCYVLEWVSYQVLGLDPIEASEGVQLIWYETVLIVRTLACCVRIGTLLNFFDNTLKNLKCIKTVRTILIYLLRTYIFLHVFAVFLFIIPYVMFKGNWPKESWIYQANLTDGRNTLIYLEALLMAICYFFGISYKYEIHLLNEQICLVFVAFCGRLYTLYLLADVLRVFGIAGVSQSMYERNMYILQQYMTEKDLPPSLRQRMLKFFEFKFQRRYFRENHIINTLSESLRTELFLFSARKLIQKVDILKRLPSATVGAIIASMKSETYSPKDVIIKLGWEINEIYFISSGTVAVIDKRDHELCHLEDGQVFGTSCLMFKKHFHAIMAVETTEVFIISKNLLIGFLRPHPDLINKLFRSAKQSLAHLYDLEKRFTKEKVDVYTELQRGAILEKPVRRLLVE